MITEKELEKWKVIGRKNSKQAHTFDIANYIKSENYYAINSHMRFDNKFFRGSKISDLSADMLIHAILVMERKTKKFLAEEKDECNYNLIYIRSHRDTKLFCKFHDTLTNLYSRLVQLCCEYQSTKAIKFLCASICHDNFAAIDSVNYIRHNISVAALKEYSEKFLYYLGIIFLGYLSDYTTTDLDISRACFDLIKSRIPQAEARIAYINLLEIDLPYEEHEEYIRKNLIILQNWHGKNDLFSSTVLARIMNYKYLMCEKQYSLSKDALILLKHPLNEGYPPAVKFYKDIVHHIKRELLEHTDERHMNYLTFSMHKSYPKYQVNTETLIDI